MVAWNQDQTDAYDPSLMGTWNKDQVDAYNLNPIGTHRQDQTGAYDPSLVRTYGQGQMDSHHQSEIDSHQPSYMNLQYITDIDDLTKIFQSSKLIKTRGSQSPHGHQVQDGSRKALPFRPVYQNPDV